MAYKNGNFPSRGPFDRRYRPSDPRQRKRERLTKFDRFVAAIGGSVLGLFLWTMGYLILVSAAMNAILWTSRNFFDLLPPYSWGASLALGFAGFGALFGAERMLDAIESGLGWLGWTSRGVDLP